MAKEVTDEDLALLGELGVDITPDKKVDFTAEEQRVIAGFEEILSFIKEHNRIPQHREERDIFERIYATRLDQLRTLSAHHPLLQPYDQDGILTGQDESISEDEALSDEELLATLGVAEADNSIQTLKHVRGYQEKRAAEMVAQRIPCEDFTDYEKHFMLMQADLDSGLRGTVLFKGYSKIEQHIEVGQWFILDGQKLFIESAEEEFIDKNGQLDQRIRVIFDNETETTILRRSLQRALNNDESGRRITNPDLGELFSQSESEEDVESGFIYVLRSESKNAFVAENRDVIHKIGVTAGEIEKRISNAKKDPTFLLADVTVVASFKLVNIDCYKLESLLHNFFAEARLDLTLSDRFGEDVQPREWFLVPLLAIEEAITKVLNQTIDQFQYDRETASLVLVKQ